MPEITSTHLSIVWKPNARWQPALLPLKYFNLGVALARWICQRQISYNPGFKYHTSIITSHFTHYLLLYCEKDENKQKEAVFSPNSIT